MITPIWIIDGRFIAVTEIPAQWVDLSDDECATVAPIPLVLVQPFAQAQAQERN